MRNIVGIFVLLSFSQLFAQEIRCNVVVNSERVETTQDNIFEEMQQAIWEFMNNRVWTEDKYEEFERIDCNLVIDLQPESNAQTGVYIANAQIQSSRPVYGSDYETLVFHFVDQHFDFQYLPGQNLIFNENSYTSELSSILGFYCYMVLGMDYDSFSEKGGDEYFDLARTVANAAIDRTAGWSSGTKDLNNRYWLADNIISVQLEKFRTGIYRYHRLALDEFTKKPKEGQQIVLQVLKDIEEIRRVVPVSILLQTFFLTKKKEIVHIFQGSDQKTKNDALAVLRKIDPTNAQDYFKIVRP